MSRLRDIINGWKNYVGNDAVALEIAKKRAGICVNCHDENGEPNLVKMKFEELMPDFSMKEIEGLKCKECGCPASTATRSEKYECPLGKW